VGERLEAAAGAGPVSDQPYRAAVIHLHLVFFADALRTHLRLERSGAQGQGKRDKAADRSTAAAQGQHRQLVWDDLVTALKEKHQDESVLAELERLRVA